MPNATYDLVLGAYLLPALFALALAAVLVTVAVMLSKVVEARSVLGRACKGGMLVLLGGLVGGVLFGAPWSDSDAVERRALEARAADLTARALVPGSALACLDAVASADVEAACEKTLFATAETVAAAIAYVDARISLLAASRSLAERDADFRPWFERARRAIETDRFGVAAHVLVTRGCQSGACTDLKVLRDSSRVTANMTARTFDNYVAVHVAAWQAAAGPDAAAAAQAHAAAPSQLAASPPAPPPAPATMGVASSATSQPSNLVYPSAASIPAVSIMNAEPTIPAAGASAEPTPPREHHEPRAKPAPAKRAQPARKQTVQESQATAPPMSVLPPPPPPPTTR